jgi:long-chain acyl-CoA synthetase
VGEPVAGAEARIGEAGELPVRGGVVFAGHHKDPEATRAAVRDGWLHAGDVVERGAGGFRVVDRPKDIMIAAGGKNLSPSGIENAVKASPSVEERAVIGERRRCVAAPIRIELDTVARRAEERGPTCTVFRSLAADAAVRDLVEGEVERTDAGLAQVARIRRFHLLGKELDHDDGEVTATMKVRRAAIGSAYAEEIEALYA